MAAVSDPRPRRSYSRLDVYSQCPRLYWAKYVLRVPEEPAVWTAGGTAFHQLAEWYLGDQWPTAGNGRSLTNEEAWDEAFAAAVEEERAGNPLADKPLAKWRKAGRGAEDVDWWRQSGPAMFHSFREWWQTSRLEVLDLGDGPMLERRLEVDLGGVRVLAIPDALVVDEHGQINVLDYKSGKPPKKTLQLGVYAAALTAATGLQATWGLYYMTRPAQPLLADLSRWPAQAVTDLFVDYDTRERAGDYEPTPGDHCRFCPLKKECDVAER